MLFLQIVVTIYLLNSFARVINEDKYGDLKVALLEEILHFGFLAASLYFVWRGS